MKTTNPTIRLALGAELWREIGRFIVAARERGELDIDHRRRHLRRCHRSWPLLVALNDPYDNEGMGVALHNASPEGIAFLCPRRIPVGSTIYIKLFWHDETAPFVPAVVRHVTKNHHGYIVGCAFAVEA
ncbi:MAG: PilZ domain-containing protein [Phycisphaerae bacterium]|nr:PilZ domain-containing protein [Phycisphaerae bacterium]